MTTSKSTTELVIVPPQQTPDISKEFVARCIMGGVHFHFETSDVLPKHVPQDLTGVRAIVIEEDEVAANAEVIAGYEAVGARIYRMNRNHSATVPNATLAWAGELTFQTICFDANLTFWNPAAREPLLARPDDRLMNELGQQILLSEMTRWYDAPRYQWECMVDGYEVTGDKRYLETAQKQMLHAISNIPNDLTNCDCVAPLIPMLRLFEITQDRRLLDYSIATFDRYLKVTPLYEGCLLNFAVYRNQVRSEILWQVLPGLMLLSRVSGRREYAEFALDQFEKLHRLLFDVKESLWSHGYGSGRRTPRFWARGTAFAFLGNLLVLEQIDAEDGRIALCRESFRQGADRLRKLQDESGFWFAVPDRPESSRESSGTAWIGAAMERGMRSGVLDTSYRKCADLAWNAVKSRIWQGSFPGHMTGTTVSGQVEYYLRKSLSESGWAHFAFRTLSERKRTEMGKA